MHPAGLAAPQAEIAAPEVIELARERRDLEIGFQIGNARRGPLPLCTLEMPLQLLAPRFAAVILCEVEPALGELG
jgi:hypothetical protein